MNFVGCLEADLQGAVEYKAGGVGPLFQESRREEPFALPELLSRTAAALRKAGLTSVVTLFVDETEIYSDDSEATDNLGAALQAAQRTGLDNALSFYLMLTHQDDDLAHVITVEASADHPAEEAAISVLDSATPLDGYDDAEDDEDEETEAGDGEEDEPSLEIDPDADSHAPLQPVEDDLLDLDVDEVLEGEELVEAFLQRLQDELHKELALEQPEVEVWTDWEGAYDTGPRFSSAVPGVPGI